MFTLIVLGGNTEIGGQQIMVTETNESPSKSIDVIEGAALRPNPSKPSVAISGPSGGTHVLPAPDANLPWTLEGTIMSMADIKDLYSVWIDAVNGNVKVGDILPVIHQEIAMYPGMYTLLRQSMEDYGQRAPIHIAYPGKVMGMLASGPMVADGIHRVAIADKLGWQTMVTSDDQLRWHEWDESEVGVRYRYLWETRLGLHR